jgi:hypothetical protein
LAAYGVGPTPLVDSSITVPASVLVIILLALPSARAYFRKEPDEADPKPI